MKECKDKGIPNEYRAPLWQILLDYLPSSISVIEQGIFLKNKRQEYVEHIKEIFIKNFDENVMRTIKADVERTHPEGFEKKSLVTIGVKIHLKDYYISGQKLMMMYPIFKVLTSYLQHYLLYF